jgi:hypothetical protein
MVMVGMYGAGGRRQANRWLQRVRSLPLARAINPQRANYYKGLTDILLTEKWVAKSAVYALPKLSANSKRPDLAST